MKAKKILYINQEIIPYVKETPEALLGRTLPQTMQENGCEIRVFMPKWGGINERRGQLHEVIRLSRMMLILDGTDHPLIIKVASIPQTRIQVYFIDNDDYFTGRKMARDADGKEYDDNGERAIFYARGVLETVKKLRWVPDVIHCYGWMSHIIPFYIRTAYNDEPCFNQAKIITSFDGERLTEDLGRNLKPCLEFRSAKSRLLSRYGKKFGFEQMQRLAVDYSDALITTTEGFNPAVLEFAKEKGKPVFEHLGGEEMLEHYEKIYDAVLEMK